MVLRGTRFRLFSGLPTYLQTGMAGRQWNSGARLSALRCQPSGLLSIALGKLHGLSVPQFSFLEQMYVVGGLSKWIHVNASIIGCYMVSCSP